MINDSTEEISVFLIGVVFGFLLGSLFSIFVFEFQADSIRHDVLDEVCHTLYNNTTVYKEVVFGESKQFTCVHKEPHVDNKLIGPKQYEGVSG